MHLWRADHGTDVNEEDYLISIESVDYSITTRAKYEMMCVSSGNTCNNNPLRRTYPNDWTRQRVHWHMPSCQDVSRTIAGPPVP